MAKNVCPNLNHGRADPPVRVCPMCGEVVNPKLPVKACSEQKHAKMTFHQDAFCIDCGKRLIN